jgi:hypothetical protein
MVCEDWVWHQGTMRFVDGSVTEKVLPVGAPMFFQDARSDQMKQFVRNETGLRKFCDYLDNRDGLRCVGSWSSQEEIDAVHHYACLFAQEVWQTSGVWMPYWFRDARLNGAHRVAYLIKGGEVYRGAVMVDALGYHTLAWVWLTPTLRRRGFSLMYGVCWRDLIPTSRYSRPCRRLCSHFYNTTIPMERMR